MNMSRKPYVHITQYAIIEFNYRLPEYHKIKYPKRKAVNIGGISKRFQKHYLSSIL